MKKKELNEKLQKERRRVEKLKQSYQTSGFAIGLIIGPFVGFGLTNSYAGSVIGALAGGAIGMWLGKSTADKDAK